MLDRLSRRFPVSAVSLREGFHYISVDATINRFNEVLPFGYDWRVDEMVVTILEGETTKSGKQLYRADVRGHITVRVPETGFPVVRGGVGSNVQYDVDNALKSAQAEAFKKAGHQFGVGLYLWDERERDLVDLVKKITLRGDLSEDTSAVDAGMLNTLKVSVQKLAEIEGVMLKASAIATHFGVTEADLQDAGKLARILAEAGLL